MRALSVKQPFAERIASGIKTNEFRSWGIETMGPLLIVASKAIHDDHDGMSAAEIAKLPLGVAVCVVDVERVDGIPGAFVWKLARARRVAPVAVRGSAAIYHVPDTLVKVVGAPASEALALPPSKRTAKRSREKAPRAARRAPRYRYTYMQGDDALPGGARTAVEARGEAAGMAASRNVDISVVCDGLLVATITPKGTPASNVFRLLDGDDVLPGEFRDNAESEARRFAKKLRRPIAIATFYGRVLATVAP